METYLFKFSACLAIFWLVYVLILERQKMHHIKRFYLLGAFAAALIIPLLTITHYVEPIVTTDFEVSPLFIPIDPSFIETPIEELPFWNLETVLWFIYGLGALLFGLRFIKNLTDMYRRISNNENVVKDPFIYVLLQDYRIPHSFFKYLFFNKSIYESNAIPKEVQLHEETHSKQLHSLDIIIVELLQIVFWFHPLIYMLKHHIKLNHEFLADDAVLSKGIDTKTYQNILLQFSSNAQEHQLSSAINYSSIKKRFTVMKTQTSKARIWISSLLLLPIIAILFFIFSTKEYIEKDNTDLVDAIEAELKDANALQMEYVDGASYKLMQEYRDFMAKFKDTNIIIGEKYERAKIIYDELMSEMQRNSVDKYPEHRFPLRSLSKVEAKKPTASQFESWKDADKFAIWIDSKPVKNSELNKYNVNDIIHFTGSKVYKNAQSAKYPQPFQFNLYTKSGFQKTYKEADIAKYHKLTERYSKAIGRYLKGSQTDNSELKILKAQADKLYQSFTKQELDKYNILPVPPVPAMQNKPKKILDISLNKTGELFIDGDQGDLQSLENTLKSLKIPSDYTFNFDWVEEAPFKKTTEILKLLKTYNLVGNANLTNQKEKATPKQIAAYNAWAKKINTAMEKAKATNDANWHPIVKLKDVNRYKAIYNAMTASQKENAEAWPSFPPLPVRPNTSKMQEKKTIKPIEITIDKNNSLVLNGTPIALKDLASTVRILNSHLTIENRRRYAMASIIIESKTSTSFLEKVQNELLKSDISASSVSYVEITKKAGLSSKHFNPYSGLTIKEARVKDEQAQKNYTKKSSPWSIQTEVTSVKFNKDADIKTGPININGKSYYYTSNNGIRTYYDTYGKEVDIDDSNLKDTDYLKQDLIKQLDFRRVILRATETLDTPAIYNVEGESVSLENTYAYINANPEAFVKTSQNSNGGLTLSFSNSGSKKMTAEDLQTEYSKIFNAPNSRSTSPIIEFTPLKTKENSNPSFLEFIIDMEQKGATFFMDDKKITAEEAKAIAKGNSGKNTDMVSQLDANGKFIVKLSNRRTKPTSELKSKKEKGGPNANGYVTNLYNSDLKKEYITKYKQYETLRYAKPHFIKKSKTDKRIMSDLWVELRQMYFFTLSNDEKNDLKLPITPFAPYVKINKDGKSYYKVNSELTDEERKASTIFNINSTSGYKGLDLLDDSDPIVIPIGSYKLTKPAIKEDNGKRKVLISISEDGTYAISKDNTYKNFDTVTLEALEGLLSKLKADEIKNTFVFAKGNDSKKFRSKPSASPEYQNDIEVKLIKDDIRFLVMEYNGEYKEHPSYQLVLDNGASDNLKSHVAKLAKLFKKYGISNLTI